MSTSPKKVTFSNSKRKESIERNDPRQRNTKSTKNAVWFNR